MCQIKLVLSNFYASGNTAQNLPDLLCAWFLQIWRPLNQAVRSSPLGMIDVQTVAREDMTPYEIRRPERLGRNFAIHYNPAHR